APLPPPAGTTPLASSPLRVSPDLAQVSPGLASRPLTINDVVAIALSTNRSMALATQALLLSQGRTAEARAAFNPTAGAGFTYTRLNRGQSVNFGGQSINIVNPDQPVFSAQVTLP